MTLGLAAAPFPFLLLLLLCAVAAAAVPTTSISRKGRGRMVGAGGGIRKLGQGIVGVPASTAVALVWVNRGDMDEIRNVHFLIVIIVVSILFSFLNAAGILLGDVYLMETERLAGRWKILLLLLLLQLLVFELAETENVAAAHGSTNPAKASTATTTAVLQRLLVLLV